MRGIIAFAIAACLAWSVFAQDSGRYGNQKVVYHINFEGHYYNRPYYAALNNIKNNIEAVGEDNISVAVVVHGAGIELFGDAIHDKKLRDKIFDLKAKGVAFLLCSNTIRSRGLDLADVFGITEADIVPSGVAEINYLQQKGYTYIKP